MTQNLDESAEPVDENWLDDGPEKGSSKPERLCLATRERLPAARMVRFVRSPDGEVFPDMAGRFPGRGVWVRSDRSALESVLKSKGGFSRGFKQPTQAAADLADQVEKQLIERCQATLGLAKRASAIILGYDQVRNELQKRRPGWLIEAKEGSDDGRRRIVGLSIALYDRVRVATALTSDELGMALGRDHVVHGLLKTGRFTDVWTRDYRRLYEFRQLTDDVWVSGTVG